MSVSGDSLMLLFCSFDGWQRQAYIYSASFKNTKPFFEN